MLGTPERAHPTPNVELARPPEWTSEREGPNDSRPGLVRIGTDSEAVPVNPLTATSWRMVSSAAVASRKPIILRDFFAASL
jgi:hypothetical protein